MKTLNGFEIRGQNEKPSDFFANASARMPYEYHIRVKTAGSKCQKLFTLRFGDRFGNLWAIFNSF